MRSTPRSISARWRCSSVRRSRELGLFTALDCLLRAVALLAGLLDKLGQRDLDVVCDAFDLSLLLVVRLLAEGCAVQPSSRLWELHNGRERIRRCSGDEFAQARRTMTLALMHDLAEAVHEASMVEVYARRLLAPERVKNCPFLEFSGCAVSDESPRRASGRGSPIQGCASPLSLGQWKSADSGRQARAVSSSHSASGGRAGSKVCGNPATGFKVQLRCFAQEAGDGLTQRSWARRSINIWRLSVFLARPSSALSRGSLPRPRRASAALPGRRRPASLCGHRATRARCGQGSRLCRPCYRRPARRGSFVTSPARGPQSC